MRGGGSLGIWEGEDLFSIRDYGFRVHVPVKCCNGGHSLSSWVCGRDRNNTFHKQKTLRGVEGPRV